MSRVGLSCANSLFANSRTGLYQFLMSVKQPDGSFVMHKGGEVDVRWVSVVQSGIPSLDRPLTLSFLLLQSQGMLLRVDRCRSSKYSHARARRGHCRLYRFVSNVRRRPCISCSPLRGSSRNECPSRRGSRRVHVLLSRVMEYAATVLGSDFSLLFASGFDRARPRRQGSIPMGGFSASDADRGRWIPRPDKQIGRRLLQLVVWRPILDHLELTRGRNDTRRIERALRPA